jgi:hypothetical protein
MAGDVVVFIDANQYIKLYGLTKGKRLLDLLESQKDYIFVTVQIVDEILRNKLRSAQTFLLANQIKGSIPDHLLGLSDERTKELRKIIQGAADELTELVTNALSKISRSEDEVSQRLRHLFENKVAAPSPCEMQRARDRKERGNPPGKPDDPLGDQITWEQLLTYCKGAKQVWIITEDQDYFIRHGKEPLLNSLLYRDLTDACGVELKIWPSDKLDDGIIDFSKKAGVKAEDLPTEQEAKEIKDEIESLPPLGWLNDTAMALSPHYVRHRDRAIYAHYAQDTGWMPYAANRAIAAMQGVRLPLRTTADEASPTDQGSSEKSQ